MNRNTFNKAVVPGLFSFMVSGYKPKNSESIWKKLCTVKSSKRAYEENAYFSNLGTIPGKPEGTSITYDEFVQGFSFLLALLKSNLKAIKHTISEKLLNRTIPREDYCVA